MEQPEKWRETIEPFSLPYRDFQLLKVLGYPHAGNDVFYAEGIYQGEPCRAFIKAERQAGADICNEIEIISKLPFDFKPEILEYSKENPVYLITREAVGDRLSVIVGENRGRESAFYMETYGKTLALLHGLNVVCERVKHRRFFELPPSDDLEKYSLQFAGTFLRRNEPEGQSECFVHGDFHYANVLWKNGEITAVLDYELSGYGVREFDIAWAVFLRPGQKFLSTFEEIRLFLQGYLRLQQFSKKAFAYYYIQIGCYFYSLGDAEYQRNVRRLLEEMILYAGQDANSSKKS